MSRRSRALRSQTSSSTDPSEVEKEHSSQSANRSSPGAGSPGQEPAGGTERPVPVNPRRQPSGGDTN